MIVMDCGFLYILKCSDNTYYIGSTNNLNRRIAEHLKGKCKYTKGLLPISLVFSQKFQSLAEARKAEKWLKSQKDRDLVVRIVNNKILNRFN